MKLFIFSVSALALFVGLSSCEKHDWKKTQKLYETHDDHGAESHGDHKKSKTEHEDHSGHAHGDAGHGASH